MSKHPINAEEILEARVGYGVARPIIPMAHARPVAEIELDFDSTATEDSAGDDAAASGRKTLRGGHSCPQGDPVPLSAAEVDRRYERYGSLCPECGEHPDGEGEPCDTCGRGQVQPPKIDDCTAAIKRSKGEGCANPHLSEQSSTALGLQQADARRDVHESTETEGPSHCIPLTADTITDEQIVEATAFDPRVRESNVELIQLRARALRGIGRGDDVSTDMAQAARARCAGILNARKRSS